MKPASSPFFAFAAVIVKDEDHGRLIADLDALVAKLRKPPGHELHWAQNIKDHADRKAAAAALAALPVRTIYVLVPKSSVRASSYMAKSTEGFYNFAARLMLERIGLFTRRAERYERETRDPNVSLRCKVTFAKVKGFHPSALREYVDKVRRTKNDACWPYLTPTIAVEGTSVARELQWADIAAGALDSAIKPDRHQDYEPSYWRTVSHLIERRDGKMLGYGLKVLGDERCLTELPWWPRGAT